MYSGPFLIIEQIGPVNFVIQRTAKEEPKIVHIDKMKLYLGDTPKTWIDLNAIGDDTRSDQRSSTKDHASTKDDNHASNETPINHTPNSDQRHADQRTQNAKQ